MNIKHKLSILLLGSLLAACTSENTLDKPTPPDQGGTPDDNTREVLLSLKNKLKVIPVETKAGDAIATAEENRIYSLDVYVFGSKTEDGEYTFLQQFYYREDARQTVEGDYATSFTLNTGADNSTALLRMKKGLFVKVYCIANSTKLLQANGTEFTDFQALLQSNPGQPGNTVTAGIPTESDFKAFHTPVLQAGVEEDVLLTPLPMTGAYTTPLDLTDFSVSARTQLGFKLTRMVARFDVVNDAALSKFTIESVSMGNGRTGAGYFPVKVLGNAPTDLITYPARAYTADQTAASPKGTGIFYCYPSPVDDGGYLILSGTYAANQTENIPVTYKVPFKPAGNETGNYIEVAYNHRYTVSITAADEYHLDFTLNVADWTDEGNVDDYKPENDFTKDAVALAETGNTPDVKLLTDGNIVMDAAISKTLAFTLATNSTAPTAIGEKLDYSGGDAWLIADGERTTTTKASSLTTFKYKMAEGIADMSDCRPVTIRLNNKASGKNMEIKVIPTALSGPEVSLVAEEGNKSTYDPVTRTLTIVNENNQTAKLKVLAPTLSGEMPTTGSSVAIKDNWITADAPSAATAEGTYTFTLSTAQDSAEATNTLTFKSTLTDATTVVNVKLKAAN
ncbi:fimbrial protein [Parabacteroides gordonii]|uniref:fimbrial protein n=1 Tax=Parabacteroides gordonii TaxID=574930 RepID=UPI0026E9B454|nr:fimbrial protein [Parabacteroides gordonii]